MENNSSEALPPTNTYAKIEGLKPSETPIRITRIGETETVMYGDKPLTEILPDHVTLEIKEEGQDTANPDGKISLNRQTIMSGKGGRLVIAHEIGHAIAKDRYNWDMSTQRKLVNSGNKGIPFSRRLDEYADLLYIRQLGEIEAWQMGHPYAELFGIGEEDWSKAKILGLESYRYGLIIDLIEYVLDNEQVKVTATDGLPDITIKLFSAEKNDFIDTPLKDLAGPDKRSEVRELFKMLESKNEKSKVMLEGLK